MGWLVTSLVVICPLMTVMYETDDNLDLCNSIFIQMNCVVDSILDSVDFLVF